MGTPTQVADYLESWVKEADVDGFNLVSSSICQVLMESLDANSN